MNNSNIVVDRTRSTFHIGHTSGVLFQDIKIRDDDIIHSPHLPSNPTTLKKFFPILI